VQIFKGNGQSVVCRYGKGNGQSVMCRYLRGIGSYNECLPKYKVQWLAFMLSIREIRVRILVWNAASLRFFVVFLTVPNQILGKCVHRVLLH
jgi:hypothetical protein